MSRDILDLIDHVVDEHDLLSADAMRWAPDAPDPTPTAACTCNWCARYGAGTCADDDPTPADIGRFCRDQLGVELTQWQRDLMAVRAAYTARMRVYAEASRPAVAVLGEFVGRIFKVPVRMLLSRPEVERRVRISRMHSDYRRRSRGSR